MNKFLFLLTWYLVSGVWLAFCAATYPNIAIEICVCAVLLAIASIVEARK